MKSNGIMFDRDFTLKMMPKKKVSILGVVKYKINFPVGKFLR